MVGGGSSSMFVEVGVEFVEGGVSGGIIEEFCGVGSTVLGGATSRCRELLLAS